MHIMGEAPKKKRGLLRRSVGAVGRGSAKVIGTTAKVSAKGTGKVVKFTAKGGYYFRAFDLVKFIS